MNADSITSWILTIEQHSQEIPEVRKLSIAYLEKASDYFQIENLRRFGDKWRNRHNPHTYANDQTKKNTCNMIIPLHEGQSTERHWIVKVQLQRWKDKWQDLVPSFSIYQAFFPYQSFYLSGTRCMHFLQRWTLILVPTHQDASNSSKLSFKNKNTLLKKKKEKEKPMMKYLSRRYKI